MLASVKPPRSETNSGGNATVCFPSMGDEGEERSRPLGDDRARVKAGVPAEGGREAAAAAAAAAALAEADEAAAAASRADTCEAGG